MKFSEIYRSNASAVHRTLESMWCSESTTPQQEAYSKQLKELIHSEIFTSESYMPLVQSMERYKSVDNVEESIKIVGADLWKKVSDGKFPPYVHQYESWKSLLTPDDCRSMVVTTGTGSGKTECFMLPLVRDLIDNTLPQEKHEIKAIFLYPLNALMEDQKSRLHKLLKDTGLTFAVYNGNLPHTATGKKDHAYVDNERKLYGETIIPTRQELHQKGADIILTNPTMLEYMLLREEDQHLFSPGSLRWIVVDEAHTFTGAAAAELSMLLRRVRKAFSKNEERQDDIHFAASSATIGNGSDKQKQENELRKFIADIGSIEIDKVDVINGQYNNEPISGDEEYVRCREMLRKADNGYIKLNELFEEGTIEEKLKKLDTLCEKNDLHEAMRAKVHFFHRVANNGITVQLDKWRDRENGILQLRSKTPCTDTISTPSLELCRCQCCGGYVAIGKLLLEDGITYEANSREENDLFDFDSNEETKVTVLFGVVDKDSDRLRNSFVEINGNKANELQSPTSKWIIAANTQGECPHCGKSVIKLHSKTAKGENQSSDNEEETESTKLTRFRVSADFIARVLSPTLLNQMREVSTNNPHRGQQYLSFVDSRSSAARSTFRQMLDVEKYWAYSRVFNELNHVAKEHREYSDLRKHQHEIEEEIKLLKSFEQTTENKLRRLELFDELEKIKDKIPSQISRDYMTWNEIYDYLYSQPDGELLCKQFADKVGNNEVNEEGEILYYIKERYIFSVMLEQFAKYPPFSASAETMGVLASYYPKLKDVTAPDVFKEFCRENGRKESDEELNAEWRNLLKIYLDRVVRSNESIYMKVSGHNAVDIFNCSERFETKKSSRRTARKPSIGNNVAGNTPIIQLLLAKIINSNSPIRDTIKVHKNTLNRIIDKMWSDLKEHGLLQYSEKIKKQNGCQVEWEYDKDKEGEKDYGENGFQLRLNVEDLAFKLPEKIHFCKVMDQKIVHYRPATTLFFGYAPYNIDSDVILPVSTEECKEIYPYLRGKNTDGELISEQGIIEWAREQRPLLYKYLWDNNGCFANQLERVYRYPETYLQAEHTAQVNKELARMSQILFKDHKINIMACSTTMEMGVDLGDLELVMMSSIPPHPANYKQRAGRSGRRNDARSACITLCSSDVVGLRVLNNPMANIINRPVDVPFVDLACPAIIQRHVNAFLLRKSGKLNMHHGSNLSMQIIHVFTNGYYFEPVPGTRRGIDYSKLRDSNNAEVLPRTKEPLGPKENTIYGEFETWLDDQASPKDIKFLLKGTSLEGKELAVLVATKDNWKQRYNEISEELSVIGKIYEDAFNEKKAEENKKHVSPRRRTANVSTGELNTKYGRFLRWKFNSILSKTLIEYLATNRFTPNADMPVNIIEFNVYNDSSRSYEKKPNNPSYPLHEALSQYAPGNVIVKENRILKVAGVDFVGNEDKNKTPFKKFITDGVDVAESSTRLAKEIGIRKTWKMNGCEELQMVQARSFIPDINATYSRVLDKSTYTQVNAQLIGAEKWDTPSHYAHLIATRCNQEKGTAKILYYNEGIGYGYCLCRKCGKMMLETTIAKNPYYKVPSDMTAETLKGNTGNFDGHHSIARQDDSGKPLFCRPEDGKYDRNVILGDLIQTDFCEIKIRNDVNSPFGMDMDKDKRILKTLGLVFCQTFTESIGKERNSVGFSIMPNNSICIFDTNPGGSGYSNHLTDSGKMKEIVERSLAVLNSIDSKEALLDKFTLRYLNDINIDGAKNLLENEIKTWQNVPEHVKSTYDTAQWSSFHNIKNDLIEANHNGKDSVIFVTDEFEDWFYSVQNREIDEKSETWKARLSEIIRENIIQSNTNLCIVGEAKMPLPIYSMLDEAKGWCKAFNCKKLIADGFYPLALANGHLYFTDQNEHSTMNGNWARGNVFVVNCESSFINDMQEIDLNARPSNYAEFKIGECDDDPTKIMSDGLYDLVNKKCREYNLDLDNFWEECKKTDAELKITYQDEHLKSAYAMVTTLQFINTIVKKCGKVNHFHLTFLNEYYVDQNGTYNDPYKGLKYADDRNDVLESYIQEWIDEVLVLTPDPNMYEINQKANGKLPHWRVLVIECGNKKISIYPNGGFINEWYFDRKNSQHISQLNSIEDMRITDSIPLFRRQPVKYEVIINQ